MNNNINRISRNPKIKFFSKTLQNIQDNKIHLKLANKLKEWTELIYIWKSTKFEKHLSIYSLLEICEWSERPYEISCEAGLHNGSTYPSCSWTLKEIKENFKFKN